MWDVAWTLCCTDNVVCCMSICNAFAFWVDEYALRTVVVD